MSIRGFRSKPGKQIWQSGCAACHGPDGKGTPTTIAGFKKPATFPDFTRCDQTTSELDTDYQAVIVHGRPFRGFSQIMSVRDKELELSEADVERIADMVAAKIPAWLKGKLE